MTDASAVPRTTLNIPMPDGAAPPPSHARQFADAEGPLRVETKS